MAVIIRLRLQLRRDKAAVKRAVFGSAAGGLDGTFWPNLHTNVDAITDAALVNGPPGRYNPAWVDCRPRWPYKGFGVRRSGAGLLITRA